MLIGLLGKKGSGKDTVADVLTRGHMYGRHAFATALKESAKIIFGLSEEQVNGPLEIKEAIDPRWNKSPREILQLLGTEVGRNIDSNVWVKRVMQDIAALPGDHVVTDVRFENEAKAIKEAGGFLVRVVRPNFGTGVSETHISETALDNWLEDYTFLNDGPIWKIVPKVQAMLDEMRVSDPTRLY